MYRAWSLTIVVAAVAATTLVASNARLVIRLSDITDVTVNGSSVTVSVPRPSGIETVKDLPELALGFDCPVPAVTDMYVAGTALTPSLLSITFGFRDQAAATEFAACVGRRKQGLATR